MAERARGSEHEHSHAPEKGLEHGVPSPATEAIPTGYPTSDRHHSETAPAAEGGDKDAAKHEHKPS